MNRVTGYMRLDGVERGYCFSSNPLGGRFALLVFVPFIHFFVPMFFSLVICYTR